MFNCALIWKYAFVKVLSFVVKATIHYACNDTQHEGGLLLSYNVCV